MRELLIAEMKMLIQLLEINDPNQKTIIKSMLQTVRQHTLIFQKEITPAKEETPETV